MKTIFGTAAACKGRLTRAKMRQPKLFFEVEIIGPSFVWFKNLSERPCLKNLFEIWERDERIAGSWLAAHGSTEGRETEASAWRHQRGTCSALQDMFREWRNSRLDIRTPGASWAGVAEIHVLEDELC